MIKMLIAETHCLMLHITDLRQADLQLSNITSAVQTCITEWGGKKIHLNTLYGHMSCFTIIYF